ncbi:MbnP family protein [Ruegeria arenilitoris]|uniref:MbnP family protein n=1 Tax=Ruegeria arenilitoris TaxID=1173585 RepID=UPI001480E1CB|nr:MbnP family protein [Ruegeria arenilitoris]
MEKTHSITLPEVPLKSVDTVQFLIGVDPTAIVSIAARGNLDPKSQMAWNWKVGCEFVVVEGALIQGNDVSPLVYHVGFSEDAREIEFMLLPDVFADGDHEVHLIVDLAKFFDGTAQVGIQALPTVKFNRTDAEMLADNYAIMITLTF